MEINAIEFIMMGFSSSPLSYWITCNASPILGALLPLNGGDHVGLHKHMLIVFLPAILNPGQ